VPDSSDHTIANLGPCQFYARHDAHAQHRTSRHVASEFSGRASFSAEVLKGSQRLDTTEGCFIRHTYETIGGERTLQEMQAAAGLRPNNDSPQQLGRKARLCESLKLMTPARSRTSFMLSARHMGWFKRIWLSETTWTRRAVRAIWLTLSLCFVATRSRGGAIPVCGMIMLWI